MRNPIRMAAFALINSKSALGAYIRRQRARLGASKAITATAHKLARLVYSMLKNGITFMALQRCGGNKTKAAALLKVNRKKIYR